MTYRVLSIISLTIFILLCLSTVGVIVYSQRPDQPCRLERSSVQRKSTLTVIQRVFSIVLEVRAEQQPRRVQTKPDTVSE